MTEMESQKTTDLPPPYARNQAISADGNWRVVNIKLDEASMSLLRGNECPLTSASIKVTSAIDDDNPSKFTWRLAEPILQENMAYEKSDIGKRVIDTLAIDCAYLIAYGRTSDFGIDPDFGLDAADGWTAVHQAALNINTDQMLRFLLEHDYSADVRADYQDYSLKLKLKQVLPLNVALHKLRFGRRMQKFLASPDRSAPSLLEKLYTLDKALEVVRLLALNTREFKHEFFNYAKEGKMVEVGALLLAAGEKLMPLYISEGEDPLNSFKEISGFLQAKNSNIDESAELKETVKLLDIYDEIGSQLSTCVALKENRRSGVEVAALLKDAGFYGKIDDRNVQDCVNRSNIALFEFKVPKMYSSWDRYLSYCKQKMSLSNLMNKTLQRFPSLSKSQDPSLRTKQLPDTTSFKNNMGASYPFGTVATKLVKAIQKVRHSRQYGSWSMRSFPK